MLSDGSYISFSSKNCQYRNKINTGIQQFPLFQQRLCHKQLDMDCSKFLFDLIISVYLSSLPVAHVNSCSLVKTKYANLLCSKQPTISLVLSYLKEYTCET